MIQKLSTTYSKEHCTCYDEYEDDALVAVMIEPESGYKLKYRDNENTYDVSGFALINVNVIDIFDGYTAIEDTEDDKELTPEQSLAYITGGMTDEDI
nr:MAG TPA: hypothetical protein [Caudoviricetes sp.]